MTTSSGTSSRTQVRTAGGLPVRFARRGAPAPGEPVPSSGVSARVAGSPATTADQRNQHGRNQTQ